MTHGGGSWRNGSAATGLPWSRLPRDFLHLYSLRYIVPSSNPVIAAQSFPASLTAIQQDVISALVNLGSKRNAAEKAVDAASGHDFDSLFRSALQAVAA
jgi:RuvA, C-terminal domain